MLQDAWRDACLSTSVIGLMPGGVQRLRGTCAFFKHLLQSWAFLKWAACLHWFIRCLRASRGWDFRARPIDVGFL